jgi:heme-degrading monooxygenase HmoA
MAVRVLIERVIDLGQEAKLSQLLMQLRSKAMETKGYISGETLRAWDNPNKFLVISTWNSFEDWKVWQNHPERKKFEAELNKLLRTPETSTVYTHF